jgi:tRNA(adenine34) deaminase
MMDHARFLDLAMDEAGVGRREGASPIGSVIVAPDGTVLSRGRNRVLGTGDQTAHAEVDAIRNAGAAIATAPAGGWILYTTVEPCLMCLGAILICPISTIVWATNGSPGGAYDAVRRDVYRPDRFGQLTVVREPSAAHRERSRALVDAFRREHPEGPAR